MLRFLKKMCGKTPMTSVVSAVLLGAVLVFVAHAVGVPSLAARLFSPEVRHKEGFMTQEELERLMPARPTRAEPSAAEVIQCDAARQNCVNKGGKNCMEAPCDNVIEEYGTPLEGFSTMRPAGRPSGVGLAAGAWRRVHTAEPFSERGEKKKPLTMPAIVTPGDEENNAETNARMARSVELLMRSTTDQKYD
jgi:hypothetical protein